MKQIKIFGREWIPGNLEGKVNEWVEENKHLIIEEIKYAMHEGYHSVMIIYLSPDTRPSLS